MRDKTWAIVPVTNTIRDVFPSPRPYGAGPGAVTAAYTGACLDQVRGELILAANGGHTDYYGNEVYAVALRKESTAWVRLTDPTPNQYITGMDRGVGETEHAYLDGKPRAVHGWNRCAFANGKVWYVGLTGMAAGNSGGSTAIYTFDRDIAGNGPFPIPSADSPWVFHGYSFNPRPGNATSWGTEGSPSVYDRISNRIYTFAEHSYFSDKALWSVDGSDFSVRTHNRVAGNPVFGGMWAAVAHDLRILMVSEYHKSNIWILNLNDPNYELQPRTTAMEDGEVGFVNNSRFGAVYHQASRAIFTYDKLGSSIRKLKIPDNPLTGTYTWSVVEAAPENQVVPVTPDNMAGTYSKFNIIEDMGNGQSAIVLVTDTRGPVYVYKIPRQGM